MRNATEKVMAQAPDLDVDGELQFDAAVSPVVAETKCKGIKGCRTGKHIRFP